VKPLRRLAAAYGVLTSYHGVEGLSRARPEALLSILRTLGAPIEKIEDADEALREMREERVRRLAPPVVTLWDDRAPEVPIVHFHGESGTVKVILRTDEGRRWEETLESESLPAVYARRGVVRRALALPTLPYGYHRLEITFRERRAESTVLAAPFASYRDRALEGTRGFGLFAPLYALHSDSSLGMGDFSDLERFADLVARYRGSFAATLPFLAAFEDEPSPYSPVSRRFWNELYVDPRRAPEWLERPAQPFESSREPLVDLRAIASWKRPLLESMAREALRARPAFLEEFLRVRPEAAEYAKFRAAAERSGAWPSWTDPPREVDLRDPRFLYHVYGQALAEEQIAAAASAAARSGVRFYFDMPLGVNRFGFDTWSNPSLFATTAGVGAPPDAVFPDGQSWGFPPILPERSRAEAHRYFRESLAHVMRHAGLLRIDHVMGLHRQFWIPDGFEKRDGVYVRYPAEELAAVLNLESHRHRTELVGENLGIVPDSVNRALHRHQWREIFVLQFRLTGNPARPLDPVPSSSVASCNTHDTPTYAGFRLGRDLEDRVEAGYLDGETARRLADERAAAAACLDAYMGVASGISQESFAAWLRLLLQSEADLVAVNLEDLWLEENPQNVPGRVERTNWSRRLRYSLTALPPDVLSILAGISRPA
jgi:4-alpha-glucanotransferase